MNQIQAALVGDELRPQIQLRAPRWAKVGNRTLKEWINEVIGGGHWGGDAGCWIIHGLSPALSQEQLANSPRPNAVLQRAGIQYQAPEGAPDLDDLWRPVVIFMDDTSKDHVYVYPRLMGDKAVSKILGPAAVWNRDTGRFTARVTDLVDHLGDPLPAFLNTEAIPERAAWYRSRIIAPEAIRPTVAALAAHTGFDPDFPNDGMCQEARDLIEEVVPYTGRIPEWFGLSLFPFQETGVYAAAAGHTFIVDEPGLGKGSTTDTRILTPDGWTTYGEVRPGDVVVGSEGDGTMVDGVFPRGVLPLMKVTCDDGGSVRVDPEHLWGLADGRVVQTCDLSAMLARGEEIEIPVVKPVKFSGQGGQLSLDPYVVGCLVGSSDPDSASNLTSVNRKHLRLLLSELPNGVKLREIAFSPLGGGRRVGDFVLAADYPEHSSLIDAASVSIPHRYLFAPEGARERLLQGILDTQMPQPGSVLVRTELVEDVTFLIRSLGGVVTSRHDGERCLLRFDLPDSVHAHRVHEAQQAFDRARSASAPSRRIVSVEEDGYGEVVCISVTAEDHLYVTEDFIVTHNTRQGLGFAALNGPDRTLVITPPLVATNWAREGSAGLGPYWESRGLPDPMGDLKTGRAKIKDPYGTFIVRPTRKPPKELPESGVLVVPYTTIGNVVQGKNKDNAELVKALIAWNPTSIVIDEAHLHRNYSTARSAFLRLFSTHFPGKVAALTGTPVISGADNLANQLCMVGQMDPLFGSTRNFYERYCTLDFFGKLQTKQSEMEGLKSILDSSSWVFRRKKDVLVQMPPKLRTITSVDIKPKAYRETYAELLEKIQEWVDEFRAEFDRDPNEAEIEAWASSRIDLLTPLRVAAGLLKVEPAVEIVEEWFSSHPVSPHGTHDDPLIIWFHHDEVLQEFAEQLRKKVPSAAIMIGNGGTPQDARGQIQVDFQDGRYAALLCTIGAFGYGLTLTRSSYEIFVETSWSPGDVTQAEDRAHRIGQESRVIINILVADDTLDPMIRGVQHRKAKVLDVLRHGGDNLVTHVDAVTYNDTEGNLVVEEIPANERESMMANASPSDILKNIALHASILKSL